MDTFFKDIAKINSIEGATTKLYSLFEKSKIEASVEFVIKAHEGQFRKSGEPYCVHPILVAAIVANYGGDDSMVISALLHDVVEDTHHDIDFINDRYGKDIAHLVEGLTKIVELREEELIPSNSNEKIVKSALTFRKMLLASISDIRVLVIKLCDRVHNMLTLNALPSNKQIRIAEETLLVYAPIAHRLGISKIKNVLEDLSFSYIFPNEYSKITNHLNDNIQKIHLKLNNFISQVEKLMLNNGFIKVDIEIKSRIKHAYSVYLKMQRKGITIEEVLDLLAIRILVQKPIDCYRALGVMHLKFNPLLTRLKDYIAMPKENGYQTIHTTVFADASIFEIQIRTFDMHKSAEFGVAAHWKYKSGGLSPNLEWLQNMEYKNDNPEEFLELMKNDLYSEEISVASPKGKSYPLPRGATALDFAYAVHSEIGDRARYAHINKKKCSLLTTLSNSDIVNIETADEPILRCSWINAVKTSRAKNQIKINCNNRLKDLDKIIAFNILRTIFVKPIDEIKLLLLDEGVKFHKITREITYLKDIKNRLKKRFALTTKLFEKIKIHRLKLKEYKFENIIIFSNQNISEVSFEHCCHPKRGDNIIAFKSRNKAIVHHKLCNKAFDKIKKNRKMLYVQWQKSDVSKYKLLFSIENTKGSLVKFLQFLADNDINITTVEVGKRDENYVEYGELEMESSIKDIKTLKKKLEMKSRVISLHYLNDAYKS